ncbi:hypothetical protein [Metabacillus arenae]|uniref:Uncharacterized protein n=1 Tax=Metabacillus arenae TaxID=2771434 RepID=A0A926N9R2_9BACI|nr:hypothetical protein [Metabacillus arenae]MBD1379364.1 hypothetical protein [Metabacillus arenae]
MKQNLFFLMCCSMLLFVIGFNTLPHSQMKQPTKAFIGAESLEGTHAFIKNGEEEKKDLNFAITIATFVAALILSLSNWQKNAKQKGSISFLKSVFYQSSYI